MLIAHLSDLHLRDDDDVRALERQLDHIAARNPDHLAITGDLLDRWDLRLFHRALDVLDERGLLDGERLTLLHGNHDLASSGGHPRRRADLWRLALRFWDPPPLVAARKRRFYDVLERRAPDAGRPAPFLKTLASGARIAVLDTVPAPWRPLTFRRHAVMVQHAIGCMRPAQIEWVSTLCSDSPLIVLLHHYPLEAPELLWTPAGALRNLVREVRVPMAIPAPQRERFWAAASAAHVRLVLCGHVHRARLEWNGDIPIGLNGQSGADWAGRTVAWYELSRHTVTMSLFDFRHRPQTHTERHGPRPQTHTE